MNILKFPVSKLALATDKKDLANFLNYDYKDFCWILYSRPIHMRYKLIEIPKKNGKIRIIHAPDSHLKQLQKNLAIQLTELFEEKTFISLLFHLLLEEIIINRSLVFTLMQKDIEIVS